MNEQEAQQAQTIKRIGEMLNTPWGHDVGVWVANCEDLREIVDPQAQKIAELESNLKGYQVALDIEVTETESLMQKIASLEAIAKINRSALQTAKDLIESKNAEIAAARKVAEKMRDASERPGGGHTFLPWERKP